MDVGDVSWLNISQELSTLEFWYMEAYYNVVKSEGHKKI